MTTSNFRVYGNIAASETVMAKGESATITADLFICALGWETRASAFSDHVCISAKKIVAFDFNFKDAAIEAVERNREHVLQYGLKHSIDVMVLDLEPSVEYQKNTNTISHVLAQLAESVGSYSGALHTVFVDCSVMPRIYIQWLTAFAFKRYAIQVLEFGYAEGIYTANAGKAEFATGISRYVAVPLLHGSKGIGDEKALLVGVGGDADVFYGLIDIVSPERFLVLVPRSSAHDEVNELLDLQVAKVRETHRLSSDEIREVSAFSLFEHLDGFSDYLDNIGDRAVVTIFVNGPKVQAIASAVVGCSDSRVQVKARIPKEYPQREVAANGKYHRYKLIDLTSPACSLPGTFTS